MSELARIESLPPAALVVARMEVAREQLAQARSLAEAKGVADAAAALCEWLRRQSDLGLHIVNDGHLLKLQAEARMGEFLARPGAVAERGRPEKTSRPVTFSAPTHKDLGINREAARRCREVASVSADTLRDLAEKATKNGQTLSRESVLKAAKRLRPIEVKPAAEPAALTDSPIPADLLNTVTCGDARELAKRLPDGSVSVAFCDPVYQNLDDYEWLARECERVLAPGGSVIAQCSNSKRFEAECAMRRSGLTFVDLLCEVYPFAICRLFHAKVFVGWKPYLWLSRGPRSSGWVMNRVHGGGKPHADLSKSLHPWGDSELFALGLLGKLCGPGDVVWDPFTGSGTVPAAAKRNGLPWVAFEIDAEAADRARARVAATPHSLFQPGGPEWEQMQFAADAPTPQEAVSA